MTTPLLGLPEISEGVVNQATIHNTGLRKMEARSFRVLSMTTTTPAVGAAEGDSYIIPVGATGVWSGLTNQMASWVGGAWSYYTPIEGIGGIWVNDLDTAYSFDGAAWVASGGAGATAPFVDTVALAKGSSDATKKVRLEVDGLTTATTRVLTVQDADGTIALTSQLAGYQPLDTDLTALAGLTSAADKGIQFTGSGTAATFDLTAAGKALLDDANAAAQRATLGLDAVYAPIVQPFSIAAFYPGAPTASALTAILAAPAGITTLTFAAAIYGSSGKAMTAATAQTDFDVRKNATTAANGTSVGTVRFAAAGTVPTFIAASGFTLTGGTDWLTLWAPATPDATLADIGISLYATR